MQLGPCLGSLGTGQRCVGDLAAAIDAVAARRRQGRKSSHAATPRFLDFLAAGDPGELTILDTISHRPNRH